VKKGYAGGGVVGAVSRAMEATGRLFGTEKAKKIDAANREMRAANVDNQSDTTKRRDDIDGAVRTATGYADGGLVVGGMRRGQFAPIPSGDENLETANMRKEPMKLRDRVDPGSKGGGKTERHAPPSGGIRGANGGLIQARNIQSGRYAHGGIVVHNRNGGDTEGARMKFSRACKGK
jgi:hypothetical protein